MIVAIVFIFFFHSTQSIIKNKITLENILNGDFYPKNFNGSWISGYFFKKNGFMKEITI